MVSLPPTAGRDALFDGVWSRPLTSEQQTLKFFALEAMHGIRPVASPDDGSIVTSFKSLIGTLRARALGIDPGHLRRAARPNELFFVVPIGKVGSIYSAAKARLGVR
jgi:hypothetical protein